MPSIAVFLEQLKSHHNHICPRQVLGVRMGCLASELLQLDLPQTHKRLFTFVETDGCFADGISVATGCWLGRRTLRLMDYGKVAAVFVDTQIGSAIRVYPHLESRESSEKYAPDESSRWHAMLKSYQIMPANELLCWQSVELNVSMQAIISQAGLRVICSHCGEEIINGREVNIEGQPLCQACYGTPYYHT